MNPQYNKPEDSVLPEDFDGVFKFTNHTDEDFTAKWNKVEYTFPSNKTSPMIMNFTPVEIQAIRKKFARELATREFYKTSKFKKMNEHVPGGTPSTYTDADLTEFIQKCLAPLPIVNAKTKVVKTRDLEDVNSRDEDGELLTSVIDQKKSLIKEGSTILKD
jgi:hypothetical protein